MTSRDNQKDKPKSKGPHTPRPSISRTIESDQNIAKQLANRVRTVRPDQATDAPVHTDQFRAGANDDRGEREALRTAATVLVNQGWQHRRTGKDAKAGQKAREALSVYPAHVDAKNLLGFLRVEKFEFREAQEIYERAVLDAVKEQGGKNRVKGVAYWEDPETRPYMRALHGYGFCLAYQGRHREALSQFTLLLRLDAKDHVGARFLLGDLHHFLDELPEAEDFYKKHPSWQSLFTYPLLLSRSGRSAEARLLLKKAFNTSPAAKGMLEDYLHCFVLWEMLGTYVWGSFPTPVLQANAATTAWNKAVASVEDEKGYGEIEEALSFCKLCGPLWLKFSDSYAFLKEGRPG
jgi:tetratricopeptide (TPR) repeat protein